MLIELIFSFFLSFFLSFPFSSLREVLEEHFRQRLPLRQPVLQERTTAMTTAETCSASWRRPSPSVRSRRRLQEEGERAQRIWWRCHSCPSQCVRTYTAPPNPVATLDRNDNKQSVYLRGKERQMGGRGTNNNSQVSTYSSMALISCPKSECGVRYQGKGSVWRYPDIANMYNFFFC